MNASIIRTLILSSLCALSVILPVSAQNICYENSLNFYVANDLGRNGYYKQKGIASLMGDMATLFKIRFVAVAGDVHHFNGVQSVHDPLWMTNYELIYSHPDLMCEWYPVMGNHEYQGNTQAVIDYSQISRRWQMPGYYYTKEIPETPHNSSMLIVFIDTPPLVDSYWKHERYSDVHKQDTAKQLRWIDEVLAASNATFKLVIGHNPIYVSEKMRSTEESLRIKLDPILRKHQVDMYIAGHSHTFQHIEKKGCEVKYIVNGSASSGRYPIEGPDTKFCSSDEGFSVISLSDKRFRMTFINFEGKPIHQIEIYKKK